MLFYIRASEIDISIHTPLAGSDQKMPAFLMSAQISIHTPLAGSDPVATNYSHPQIDFNPHSPCGERR